MTAELFPPLKTTVGTSQLLTMSLRPKEAHPQTDFIMSEAYKIAKELNIISEGYADYSTFVPDLFPEAAADRVIDVTIFFNSLYYLDNLFGEDTYKADLMTAKPELKKLQTVWLTGQFEASSIPAINNLLLGILKFRNRLLQKGNALFYSKITQSLFTHLQHALAPAEYQTVEEYIESRRWSGGMDATLDLYDYVYENYLPNAILKRNKYINRLNYLCNLHPTLSNDIFSYPAEKHSKFNLINVFLETKEAHSFKEAVFKSINLVNDYDREFKKLYDNREVEIAKIEQKYRPQVRQYIESLRNCLAASYDWQISTPRYKHPKHFLRDMR